MSIGGWYAAELYAKISTRQLPGCRNALDIDPCFLYLKHSDQSKELLSAHISFQESTKTVNAQIVVFNIQRVNY